MASSDITPELVALLTTMNTLLPFEIVSKILVYIKAWSCNYSVIPTHVSKPQVVWGGEAMVLSTKPLSHHDISTLCRITFFFTSKDQGWSSYPRQQGIYDASWTWWEAVRPSPQDCERISGAQPDRRGPRRRRVGDTSARRYELQRNGHAGRDMAEYTINLDKWHDHHHFGDLCENDAYTIP
jgi:hypothetical protein